MGILYSLFAIARVRKDMKVAAVFLSILLQLLLPEADAAGCGEGWVEMANSCPEQKDAEQLCVKIGKPLQYVSWLHFQYVCDKAGGRLPEPTDANINLFNLLIKSYTAMYGKTLMFLGATDATHTNEWL